MTKRMLSAGLMLLSLTVVGCGAGGTTAAPAVPSRTDSTTSATAPTHSHAGHDHAHMTAAEKVAMAEPAAAGPSQAAAMVCGAEVRAAVTRTLALERPVPAPSSSWDARGRRFSCVYPVPGGELRMSVQDARDPAVGRAVFAATRSSLTGATRLTGVAGFGLPAVESPDGTVVFLKDGKTLSVDAGGLSAGALPEGFDRTEVAYGVAAAVIACWTG